MLEVTVVWDCFGAGSTLASMEALSLVAGTTAPGTTSTKRSVPSRSTIRTGYRLPTATGAAAVSSSTSEKIREAAMKRKRASAVVRSASEVQLLRIRVRAWVYSGEPLAKLFHGFSLVFSIGSDPD